jgi:hypothetical protein
MHRMTTDTSELLRLLLNLIRFGTIADIDHDTQHLRVQAGKNTTTWRPWISMRVSDARTWFPPSLGELVIMLSPEGDFTQAAICQRSIPTNPQRRRPTLRITSPVTPMAPWSNTTARAIPSPRPCRTAPA